jgi:membrane protein involved in colicin uptake
MAVPAKLGAMIGTTASDASMAEDIFGNTFGTAKLEMSPEVKRKLRFARQVAGVHEDQFSWNRAPENIMPTREEVMAKKAADARAQMEAQAKAAAAAEAKAQAQKEAEAEEQVEKQASTAEIIMSDYSMSFLPCVIFLFIIVVAVFAATLGAFWVPNFLF